MATSSMTVPRITVLLCLILLGAMGASAARLLTPRGPKRARGGKATGAPQGAIMADSEPGMWAAMILEVMHSTHGVSWKLFWEDLGLGAVVHGAMDDPTLGGKERQMMELVGCMNSRYKANAGSTGNYMSWDLAMDNALHDSTFKVVGAWWSNHDPAHPITAVTSTSVNRLPQLYAQCKSWSGPLSAALYVPLVADANGVVLTEANKATLASAALEVSQFVADMQQLHDVCTPDIILVWEAFQDEPSSKLLYPLNAPRNFARLQARTPLMAEVDIDLVIARSVSTRFMDPATARNMLQQAEENKTVFIIPAFDIGNSPLERAAWADALASYDKDMMVFAMTHTISHQFDVRGYPQGHNITDYDRWTTATQDYAVQHGHMAEPWFLGSRTSLPWHDDRYRGYGKDKVQYVEDTHYKGFNFKVLHDGFVIHRAHKKGEAANLYLKQLKAGISGKAPVDDENMYTHMNAMYKEQCERQEAGLPFLAPVLPATLKCQESLSWWQGAPSLEHLWPQQPQRPQEQQPKPAPALMQQTDDADDEEEEEEEVVAPRAGPRTKVVVGDEEPAEEQEEEDEDEEEEEGGVSGRKQQLSLQQAAQPNRVAPLQ